MEIIGKLVHFVDETVNAFVCARTKSFLATELICWITLIQLELFCL